LLRAQCMFARSREKRDFLNGCVCLGVTLAVGVLIDSALWTGSESHALVASARLPTLRVCADPNDLPSSNGNGEKHAAQPLGHDLDQRVEYTWSRKHRGSLRKTLSATRCDVVMDTSSSLETAQTITPQPADATNPPATLPASRL
jgi:hypothetical protein